MIDSDLWEGKSICDGRAANACVITARRINSAR